MTGMINIQAEDLMCSLSGVSGGQDLVGFLLSTFLPLPKCEVSHMLSITPNPLSISLLSVSNYGIIVTTTTTTTLQEQINPRKWSDVIIKYVYAPPSKITIEAPPLVLLIDILMSMTVRCLRVLGSEQIQLSLLQVSTFLWTATA